jgi:AcrR family transcriptional regulator
LNKSQTSVKRGNGRRRRAPRHKRAAPVDDRRAYLLCVGRRLFAHRPFDDLSIDDIARDARVAKGLLYYYFGSKRGFYVAVVEDAARELRELGAPQSHLPPQERLERTIDAYLGYVADYPEGYRTLMAGGIGSDADVREILDRERNGFLRLIAEAATGSGFDPSPALRAALQGWMSFIEGASLDWLAHRDLEREKLREIIIAALPGALAAAVQADPKLRFDRSILGAARGCSSVG